MVTPQQLKNDNILGLIASFSGPAIAGMLMMSVYNITDRIFIGQTEGPLAIAGLAVAHPMMMMIKGSLGILIGLGAAALLSLRMGEGKEEEAKKILGNAFTLIAIAGISASLIMLLFLDTLLTMFGASKAVLPFARSYAQIILVGSIFHIMGLAGTNLIRAAGSPRAAMVTNLIGACTNIVLDAVFVLGCGLGVTGAAIATVISQVASAAWVIWHFVRGSSVLTLCRAHLRLTWARTREIATIGAPPFLRSIINSAVMILLNNSLLIYGGDIAVSAMGVIFSLHSLLVLPLLGLSNGAQPVIGFNFGAGQFRRVKQALFYAAGIATVIVVAVYLAVMFAPAFLLRLFTNNAQLIEVGTKGLRIYMFLLPVVGFQLVGSNYFQATGRSAQAIFLNLARQCIFLIPMLLILPRFLKLQGVWMAQPVADAMAFLVTALFVYLDLRKLPQKEAEILVTDPETPFL
ncbi:MAG TPA: MATE family efflux transporter [Firmicutes bacterium]|nr:MATE family efflux transporter [Bacillota bacterium]